MYYQFILLTTFDKTLVQCPHGTAGKNCKKCPVNTYADTPGLALRKQCGKGKLTEQIGSIRKSQCITPRKLDFNLSFIKTILY